MKLGAHGTGSSSATHPAAVFGPGGRPAGDAIVAERVTKGAVEHAYWRYEDQLNSCVGQADENGWRRAGPVDWRESAAQAREASRKRSGQNSYLAFGEVMQSRVLYDGAVSRLSAVEYDGLALTTIRLANNDLSTDLLNVEGSCGARESELCEREVMPRLRPVVPGAAGVQWQPSHGGCGGGFDSQQHRG